MYTLYYSPGACSLAVHSVLHSLDIPFETVRIDISKGENRTPEYLKINPRGQVPVLVINGKRQVRESGVIATYLIDKHKSPLLPADGDARLRAMEWLSFYNSTMHQAYSNFFLMQNNLKDEAVKQGACELIGKRISVLWKEIEAHLAENKYLAGDIMTIADIFLAVIANWNGMVSDKIKLGPNTLRVCKEISALPYFQQALAAEKIKYRVV